jgi:Fusaric acid resistance protein family
MAAADLSSGRLLQGAGAIIPARWLNALKAAGPPLLFGLRLWASVSLALYVAFWLELDNPVWAGTSAAIVCQPTGVGRRGVYERRTGPNPCDNNCGDAAN